jgi:heme-degrading monooxygenase HmoA
MTRHLAARFLAAALTTLALLMPSLSRAALDDPSHVVTVMQFSAKSKNSVEELKKRMLAMRDFQRRQPGYVENAVFENRNQERKPQFVGVARWKSLKDWEALWQNENFQKLVRSISEVGEINPGVFTAVN